MTRTILLGGRVIDPSQSLDRVTNLAIENGHIASLDVDPQPEDEVIDVAGQIVAPGLVDLHAELREPGFEEDESIASGTAAAVAGGFTSVACLPNTEPAIDSEAMVQFVQHQSQQAANARVHVIACVSKGRQGEELAEMGALVQAGAAAFSDADAPIHNTELLRQAFDYSRMFDKPILNTPEVPELSRTGVMHEGSVSMVLGLPGLAAEAEDVMTNRDLRLAEATAGRLHLMNLSTVTSVELVRRAKARDVRVTAAVCPHHFSLTDDCLTTFDTNCKVRPPLRSQEHVDACIEGLKDGTLDVISSGHTPRAVEKKMLELDRAPFGVVSLETTLGLVVTELIEPGHLDWPTALAKLTMNPARVLGIPHGTLAIGAPADVTVIDPQHAWTVTPSNFHSKSVNTPIEGRQLRGKATHVLVGGKRIFLPAAASAI